MIFLANFAALLGVVITACIFLWEIYIVIRFIAEDLIKPIFLKINDFLLRIWIQNEIDQQEMWERWRDRE